MADEVLSDTGYSDDELNEIPSVGDCNAKTVKQVLDCFGSNLVKLIQHSLKTSGHKGSAILSTGKLFQAGDWQTLPIGGGLEFKFFFKDAPYWREVDEGTDPGVWPKNLKPWVAQKVQAGKIVPSKLPLTESGLNGLTYVIGRSIADLGTPATNFYSKVVTKQMMDRLRDDIAKASKNETRIITKRILKDNLIDALKGKAVKVTKK